MGPLILAAVAFSSLAIASFDGNLNYESPSKRHEGLGIDVPRVARRSLVKRAAPWDPVKLNFTHGVASGDPYPHSVILWTRIAPSLESDRSNVTVSGYVPYYSHETEQYIKASPHPICIDYRVGTDANLAIVVDKGTAYTTSDIDFTVKVRRNIRHRRAKLIFERSRRRTCSLFKHTTTNSMFVAPTLPAHLEGPKPAPIPTTTSPRLD